MISRRRLLCAAGNPPLCVLPGRLDDRPFLVVLPLLAPSLWRRVKGGPETGVSVGRLVGE